MTSSITGRPITAFAVCLFLVASFGTRAVANIYLDLVVDPATTAFSGILPSAGFTGTSTRSGAGTWHLYALDDPTNFGISGYQIKLNGTLPVINHRSPVTLWDDVDEDGPFTAGFNTLRTSLNHNPIGAVQGPTDSPKIGGLGQTANNFGVKIPAAGSFLVSENLLT